MREAAAGVVLLRHVDAHGDEAFHDVKFVAPARELRGRDAALGARVRIDARPLYEVLNNIKVPVARRVVQRRVAKLIAQLDRVGGLAGALVLAVVQERADDGDVAVDARALEGRVAWCAT